ncbi:hypothetical protein N7488_006611 [Penicillium malachiteum]|nr:hypothetical protein N7488_006611 [Penicillium malachiteum]
MAVEHIGESTGMDTHLLQRVMMEDVNWHSGLCQVVGVEDILMRRSKGMRWAVWMIGNVSG